MEMADYTKIVDQQKKAHRGRTADVAITGWLDALPAYARRGYESGMSIEAFDEIICKSKWLFSEFLDVTKYATGEITRRQLWQHKIIDPFDDSNEKIDGEELKDLAASYVASRSAQNNYLDWCFLDALIFLETTSFLREMMLTRFGTALNNPAFVVSGRSQILYVILKPLFWFIGFAVNYIATLVGGIYFILNDHQYWGWGLIALFGWTIIAAVLFLPKRWKIKKQNMQLLEKMLATYRQLDGATISPRRLKEAADDAARSGVVFDGAVFAIIDRMFERDPSTFVKFTAH
jgi:hypothetical protein